MYKKIVFEWFYYLIQMNISRLDTQLAFGEYYNYCEDRPQIRLISRNIFEHISYNSLYFIF